MPAPLRVAIVAYEGVSALDLSGPLDAFHFVSSLASQCKTALTYECIVVSSKGRAVTASGSAKLLPTHVRALDGQAIDTLIVPGACIVDDVTRDRKVVDWVRSRAKDCRRVCSVCVGSFLLAESGLLDGRSATTHWMHASRLAQSYPKVTVQPDAIYVRDGNIWTSAGVTAGIDLALALIEQDAGRKIAMAVARGLVVYMRRAGGQSQYSALLSAQTASDDDQFSQLELWIAENLTQDLSVQALARRAKMSPRNFARVYAARRGRTPAKVVEAIRVDAARGLLEDTRLRIKAIAVHCGFKNEEHMRTAFMRNIQLSPKEYRMRFSSH